MSLEVKMETENKPVVRNFALERQKLLRMVGWVHAAPLPQLVLALLGWYHGTREGKLIPGRTVYTIPVEAIAHFLVFYCPVLEGRNSYGISREDLNDVIRTYNPTR
jgi:hypothetical protein